MVSNYLFRNKIEIVDMPNGKTKYACPTCHTTWRYKDSAIGCYKRCNDLCE